jgi:hypothetical protein
MRLDILSYGVIRRWIAVVICVAIFSFATNGNAQSAGTASIQGSITDATGASIQSATVTAINAATQVKQIAITEGNGHYSLPNMAIGTYTLDVVAPGFEHYTQSNIVLEVGSSISVNVGMTVGRTDQRVEVQASGLSLQTEDVSFKQTIDQQTVTEMPLNGRQMTNLIALSGGSTPAPGGDFTGSKYSYQVISVSIAGGMGNTTMWRLDGGTNNDYMANGNLPFPFPDAVSQFSVESTALSAPLSSSATTTSMHRISSPRQRTPCIRISLGAPSVVRYSETNSSPSPDTSDLCRTNPRLRRRRLCLLRQILLVTGR